jgi:hypothetical protein
VQKTQQQRKTFDWKRYKFVDFETNWCPKGQTKDGYTFFPSIFVLSFYIYFLLQILLSSSLSCFLEQKMMDQSTELQICEDKLLTNQ